MTNSNQQQPSPATATRNLEQAAEIEKATEWVLARLIASSVELAQAGRPSQESRSRTVIKVSVTVAEKILSKSHQTIRAYLKAWDAAAADGHCKPSSNLAPEDGWTTSLPEAHLWERYRNPNSHSTPRSTTTIPAVDQMTTEQKAETARAILANDPQVARSIVAEQVTNDREVAVEAEKAITAARVERVGKIREKLARADEQAEATAKDMNGVQFVLVTGEMNKAKVALRKARSESQGVRFSNEQIDLIHEEAEELKMLIGSLLTEFGGVDWDAELANLSGGDL